MLDFIRQWSVNIVALALFIFIAEILLPSGKLKKHAGLVTGTVLIISIITPLAGALDKDFDFEKVHTANSATFDRMQIEKDSKYLEKMQMEQIVEVYRKKIISQMEDLVKEIEGVKDARADIIFNEDYNSPDFGIIRRAYIEVETVGDSSSGLRNGSFGNAPSDTEDSSLKTGESSISTGPTETGDSFSKPGDSSSISTEPIRKVEKIEKIEIGGGAKNGGKDKSDDFLNDDIDPALKNKIEQKIAEAFGLDKKDVIVSKMKR